MLDSFRLMVNKLYVHTYIAISLKEHANNFAIEFLQTTCKEGHALKQMQSENILFLVKYWQSG